MCKIKYGKYEDLREEKFFRLKIIEEIKRRYWTNKHGKKRSVRRVRCLCDCGNYSDVDIQALTRSNDPIMSCGCYNLERAKQFRDLSGEKFGKWTVLKFDRNTYERKSKNNENNMHYWMCECECGEVRSVRGGDLTFGKSLECGQCSLNSVKVGSVYEKLTVVRLYEDNGYYLADCKCSCGGERKGVHRDSLYGGLTRSCGCVISFGEEKVNKFLIDNDFIFEREVYLEGCIHKKKLYFDFVVYKNIEKTDIVACIEYDGEYHYKQDIRHNAHDTLKNIQTRDEVKNKFCRDNNIKLIRIPYWEYENINDILEKEF